MNLTVSSKKLGLIWDYRCQWVADPADKYLWKLRCSLLASYLAWMQPFDLDILLSLVFFMHSCINW